MASRRISGSSEQVVRIGTAGWSISRQHGANFRGGGSHLERYARVMNAVEINTSFYRPHKRETYERWAASTPATFRFAVKAPKQLTHEQRLADPTAGLDSFASEIAGLGGKLGVVLVQLPPSLTFEKAMAGRFFRALARRVPAAIVCEPRHATWFSSAADAWLAERRVARAAADPAPAPCADRPGGWTGLSYVRLHGSPRMYWSAYDAKALGTLAGSLPAMPRPVWCMFDNTASSAALGDALALMKRLRRS